VVRLTTKLGYLMIPMRCMIGQAAKEDSTISGDAHKNAVSSSVNGAKKLEGRRSTAGLRVRCRRWSQRPRSLQNSREKIT
jgi:hypothetical protein